MVEHYHITPLHLHVIIDSNIVLDISLLYYYIYLPLSVMWSLLDNIIKNIIFNCSK